jgi:serine protease inhibitor
MDFALQLYNKINAKNSNQNVVFSPFSIILALALLETESSGQTQADLKKILAPIGYNGDTSILYQSLQHQLQIQVEDPTLSLANSLYYKNSLKLKSEYLQKVKNCFETKISKLDFTQTETARLTINRWIPNKTEQKIPELI